MKQFLVIYHAPAADANMQPDPEEMKKVMGAWKEWMEKCGEGMVDMGNPAGNGMRVTKDGTSPSDKEVAGYSMLQAESMEEAVKLLDGHPHLDMPGGCNIEIHEVMPIPQEMMDAA